jgi:hypothetical protein
LAAGAACAGLRSQQLGLDTLRAGQQSGAGSRQLAAAGPAQEKTFSERQLKSVETPCNGCVVEGKPARRTQNLPVAGNGEKYLEVVPIHGSRL